jgi:F0F1-type ATP synthase assembly protein I
MAEQLPGPKELGRYYALAQVGLEMAVPIGIGAYLDYRFGWGPWAAIVGAVLGFGGGMLHLLHLVNQANGPPQPPRDHH